MGYINKAYYDNEYKGVPIEDESTFNRLEARASDLIDMITSFVLLGVEFSSFAQLIQTNVKKAVAAQIEYMVSLGGELTIHGDRPSSVNIGNFSYSEGGNQGKGQLSREQQMVSPAVIQYLKLTGLLYRGVNVRDSSYSNSSAYPFGNI